MTEPRIASRWQTAKTAAIAATMALLAGVASAQRYIQHNLVSDVPKLAARTDPNLVNAWGIASSGPFTKATGRRSRWS
jgi:hypothetical protein